MMLSKKLITLFVGLAASLVVSFFGVSEETFADSITSGSIYDKAIYNGVQECYSKGYDDGGLINEISLEKFKGIGTLADEYKTIVPMIGLSDRYGSEKPSRISCVELFQNKTAVKIPGQVASIQAGKTELENALYKSTGSNSNSTGDTPRCYKYYFNFGSLQGISGSTYSQELCVKFDESSKQWQTYPGNSSAFDLRLNGYTFKALVYRFVTFESSTGSVKMKTITGGTPPFNLTTNNRTVMITEPASASSILVSVGNIINSAIGAAENASHFKQGFNIESNGQHAAWDFTANFYSACEQYEQIPNDGGIKCVVNGQEVQDYSLHFDNSSGTSSDTVYKKIDANAHKNEVIAKFSGNKYTYALNTNNASDIKFSKEEKYRLYTYYLENVFQASKMDNCRDEYLDSLVNYYKPVKLWDGSKYTWCYPEFPEKIRNDTDKNQKPKVYGVYPSGYFGSPSFTLKTIIDELNAIDWPENSKAPTGDDGDNGDGAGGGVDPCYESGIGEQGWMICPVIRNLTQAVGGMAGTINYFLTLDKDEFQAEGSTESVWSIFRNMANIFMIIVLLVIVFSQLTGYGIDNYGVKKILPKLVIMAILINLSFIICELAVDVSNVLGNGLYNLFRNIGEAANIASDGSDSLSAFAATIEKIIMAAAGVGAVSEIAMGFVGAQGGAMIIILVLIALITAAVAILIFLIMLGGRMVVAMLFTIISPLAFACYILPNTQVLFKKWWSVFKAALVVYPICGALYGISFLIRGLAEKTSGNFVTLLAVNITPFLPFLALPMLLRSMMNALGVLGGALTSLSSGLRGGVGKMTRTLQGTEIYKSGQENRRRNMTRWQAGVDKNGNKKKLSAFGRMLRGGNTGIGNASAQYIKDKYAKEKEESYVSKDSKAFSAAMIAQKKTAEADDVKNQEIEISSATNGGANEKALFKIYRDAKESGDIARAVAAARIAGRRKDSAARFMDNEITGVGYNLGTTEGRASYNSMLASNNSSSDEVFAKVAKEIAEGEHSGNFKEASPVGFDFASSYNKNYDPDIKAENPEHKVGKDYSSWANQTFTKSDGNGGVITTTNAAEATSRYVAKSQDLVAMQGGALNEIANRMANGQIDGLEKQRLMRLAQSTIKNKDVTGVWDTTKENQIYRIANGGMDTGFYIQRNNGGNTGQGIMDIRGGEKFIQEAGKKQKPKGNF